MAPKCPDGEQAGEGGDQSSGRECPMEIGQKAAVPKGNGSLPQLLLILRVKPVPTLPYHHVPRTESFQGDDVFKTSMLQLDACFEKTSGGNTWK